LGIRDITSRFIEHHAEEMDRKVTPKWVGGIIRRRLGLRTVRRPSGYVVPASETPRLEQLYEKYGLGSEGTGVPDPSDRSPMNIDELMNVDPGNAQSFHPEDEGL